MKLIFLIILLPVFLFSYEVKFNKIFYHELPHDTLTANIKIEIEDDSEIKVGERLDVYNQKIKSYDKVEKKFGNLNIRPIYRHSTNTPKVVSYIGELKYKINSRKARFMDEFISIITSMKRNRDTNIAITNLSWTVRQETYDITLDLLRLEAITWVNTYSKNISKDLHKECTLKDIIIEKQKELMTLRIGNKYSSETSQKKILSVPEMNQEKIVIDSNFVLECK